VVVTDIWLIVVAIALVPLGGLFAAMDTALLTVSVARVDDMIREDRPGSTRLRRVLVDRATYVGLTTLLRIVCEIAATAIVAVVLFDALAPAYAVLVTVAVMAIVSYVVVGVGPRTLGRQHAYSIGLASAAVLQALGFLIRPITRLLILLGNAITPGKGFRNGPFATEVELRELVDMAEARGVVDAEERRMIQSVFDLGDTSAREVMVPRPEMIWIESDKTPAQAMSLAVRSGHSRIPVIGENPDDVLGIVYLKDLAEHVVSARWSDESVRVADVMRPAEFIPDSKPLDKVLSDMQRLRNHMAMLVDEYGGIAGLVTIEDVLEEIVGEINDEYDTDEVPPVDDLGDDRIRVSTRLPVEDLGELFGVEIDDDEVDTVGGLIALELGRVPLPGARIESHGLELVAEGGANRQGRLRITSAVVRRLAPAEDTDDETRSSEDHADAAGRA
jgi:CBS domain containing-hemolysin-like protein